MDAFARLSAASSCAPPASVIICLVPFANAPREVRISSISSLVGTAASASVCETMVFIVSATSASAPNMLPAILRIFASDQSPLAGSIPPPACTASHRCSVSCATALQPSPHCARPALSPRRRARPHPRASPRSPRSPLALRSPPAICPAR
eukprot:5206601-Prymnesium_polylepis.1